MATSTKIIDPSKLVDPLPQLPSGKCGTWHLEIPVGSKKMGKSAMTMTQFFRSPMADFPMFVSKGGKIGRKPAGKPCF